MYRVNLGIVAPIRPENTGARFTSLTRKVKALVTLPRPSSAATKIVCTEGPIASDGVHEKIPLEITDPAGPLTNRKDTSWAGTSSSVAENRCSYVESSSTSSLTGGVITGA